MFDTSQAALAKTFGINFQWIYTALSVSKPGLNRHYELQLVCSRRPESVNPFTSFDGPAQLKQPLPTSQTLPAPGVFTTAIISFFIAWNDFVYGISLTSTSAARPVPAALSFFTGASQFQSPVTAIMAASVAPLPRSTVSGVGSSAGRMVARLPKSGLQLDSRPFFEYYPIDGRYDAKTALQEIAVRESGELPAYRVDSTGPDHDKRFVAHVYMGEELYGTGSGRSKKEAEYNAAREALARQGAELAAIRDSLSTEGTDTLQRLGDLLDFFETTTAWYEQLRRLPTGAETRVAAAGEPRRHAGLLPELDAEPARRRDRRPSSAARH